MTVLHSNSCYNEVCYIETARYYEYSIYVCISTGALGCSPLLGFP